MMSMRQRGPWTLVKRASVRSHSSRRAGAKLQAPLPVDCAPDHLPLAMRESLERQRGPPLDDHLQLAPQKP
jgi:hypothetical protein